MIESETLHRERESIKGGVEGGCSRANAKKIQAVYHFSSQLGGGGEDVSQGCEKFEMCMNGARSGPGPGPSTLPLLSRALTSWLF